jgi:hypothetical protein
MPGISKFTKAWLDADESGRTKLLSAVNHEIVRKMTGLAEADMDDLANVLKFIKASKGAKDEPIVAGNSI